MQIGFKNTIAALMTSGVLLAPTLAHATLVISNKPTQNVTCESGACTAGAPKAILNASDLSAMLAQFGDVYVGAGIAAKIVFDAPLSWTSTGVLSLQAAGSVTIAKPISVAGPGGLAVTAYDLLFMPKGSIDFWDLKSNLTINGQAYTLVGDIATLAGDIAKNAKGNYALARNYDASIDGAYGAPAIRYFDGVFEGLGHQISNLTFLFSAPRGTTNGLFNNSYGTIRDFGLTKIHATFEGSPNMVLLFGALAITNYGLVQHVFASGHLDLSQAQAADGAPIIGGLLAANAGMVEDSHTDIDLAIAGDEFQLIGGVAGYNQGTISKSYSEGKILPTVVSITGGLTGDNHGVVKNSYSSTLIDNAQAAGGGLTGLNNGKIISSYAAGKMQNAKVSTGGIIAVEHDESGGLSKSYWDLGDGVSDSAKAAGNVANYPGGTGLTTVQLKSGLPDGFDPRVWAQNAKINSGYPYLIANPPMK